MRAVGSTVHARTPGETFHEFILDLFGNAIGYDWIASERVKPEGERHPLSIWGQELVEAMQQGEKQRTDKSKPFGIKQSGNLRALLALAYDYYSLSHCSAKIQPKFIKRLKNKDNFQGARYEMAVAGIAVRAGFEIAWINEKVKHCEFKGTHKRTGVTSYFECKSHHRDGVLGSKGDFTPDKTRMKIIDHFIKATKQADRSHPLIIFDDVNLPITPTVDFEEKEWHQKINESFKQFKFHEVYKQTSCGALFITNFSWHFHKELDSLKENEVIAYFHVGGKYSLRPETVSLLKTASEQYGFVPAKFDEFAAKEET